MRDAGGEGPQEAPGVAPLFVRVCLTPAGDQAAPQAARLVGLRQTGRALVSLSPRGSVRVSARGSRLPARRGDENLGEGGSFSRSSHR